MYYLLKNCSVGCKTGDVDNKERKKEHLFNVKNIFIALYPSVEKNTFELSKLQLYLNQERKTY